MSAYKLAIASGKGGTGKTTVSVSLYNTFAKKYGNGVKLADCDVEEPNDKIFFPEAEVRKDVQVNLPIAHINTDKCSFCRECVEYCEFNAIVVIPPVKFAEVNKTLCHSCGACLVACKQGAITEYPESIGRVIDYGDSVGDGVIEGRLKIGSAMQTPLIKEVKKRVSQNGDIVIYDAPPGTSCPVVETVNDADYVVLVSEPTPFGLHDLKLMVGLMKELDRPFGVVVNKAGMGNNEIYNYLKEENIELIGEIPFEREFAEKYSVGTLSGNGIASVDNALGSIAEKLGRRVAEYEGNNYSER